MSRPTTYDSKTTVNLCLTTEMHKELMKVVQEKNMHLSAIVREALTLYLKGKK